METLCDITGEGHEYPDKVDRSCGVLRCYHCDNHVGGGTLRQTIVDCICGWSVSGNGDGRKNLIEAGETIGDEPGWEWDFDDGMQDTDY